jgi:hypothetical protein
MNFNANIDLRKDNSDSIGIVQMNNSINLNIMKNGIDLSIRLSKSQTLKIKQFLENIKE